MKKTFITSLILLLIAFNPAFGADCRKGDVTPKINFTTSYGRLTYNFEHNTQSITKMAEGSPFVEKGMYLAGLAPIKINTEYSMRYKGVPLGKNDYCVFPEEINVFVGFHNPEIYVSKDYPKGSCEYNLILRHEQAHQQINKTTLDYFIPYFKKSALKIAADIGAVKVKNTASMKKVSNKMQDEFTSRFNKIVDLFRRELAIEQGKLDNSINYAAENKICRRYKVKRQR